MNHATCSFSETILKCGWDDKIMLYNRNKLSVPIKNKITSHRSHKASISILLSMVKN